MRLLIAAIVTVASVSACGTDTPRSTATPTTPTPIAEGPPPAPARVEGVVLDFQTAKPLPGVVVGFAPGSFGPPTGITETAVTDAAGRYSLPEPPGTGRHTFFVDNKAVGTGYPRSRNSRGGDVAVDRGSCIARYGLVLDSRTFLPIVGATARDLSNRPRVTTDKDGWYHMDWGCGAGHLGFNTRWDIMSHPDYNPAQFAGGRGIGGNFREDVLLTPR